MKKKLFKDEQAILDDLIRRFPALEQARLDIQSAADSMAECFKSGGKALLCGNGGSASDCLHIVGELMKCFSIERKLDEKTAGALTQKHPHDVAYFIEHIEGALPAIALVENSSLGTAFANDVRADLIYAQQVYGLGKPGDVLLCLSTSGNAKNAVYAAMMASAKGMKVISLTGGNGGALKGVSDVSVIAPESETYKVQEYHLPIYHALCMMLEYRFFA